ncbi:MAG: hypothetical protein HC824_14145, partial [Synechococcales cyanobacterium RM1_1_8]|nr:hypothetical protein [Synechococcales cyanobacterium RM1_1_8]
MARAGGGDLYLETQDLTLLDSGKVTATIFANRDQVLGLAAIAEPSLALLIGLPDAGKGQGGNVTIQADRIAVDGFNSLAPSSVSQISSITLGSGNAGNLDITTRELRVSGGGVVVSSSVFSILDFGAPVAGSGLGNGGNVSVRADDITLTGVNPITGLSSTLGSQTIALGNAGNTTIQTRRLWVGEGGALLSGTFASGDGGLLDIQAQSIRVDGGDALTGQPSRLGTFAAAPSAAVQRTFFVSAVPEGNTGRLVIRGDRLEITNGAQVGVAHQGFGSAGSLDFSLGSLRLANQGQLNAATAVVRGETSSSRSPISCYCARL